MLVGLKSERMASPSDGKRNAYLSLYTRVWVSTRGESQVHCLASWITMIDLTRCILK